MLKWKKRFSSSNASKDEIRRRECLSKLNESLVKLEDKEKILQSKISIENERTKNFTKSRNNKAVLECKKRKSFYEAQVEQLEIFHENAQGRSGDGGMMFPSEPQELNVKNCQLILSFNTVKLLCVFMVPWFWGNLDAHLVLGKYKREGFHGFLWLHGSSSFSQYSVKLDVLYQNARISNVLRKLWFEL
ncbi:hypothetical protein C5167_002078 [Papaver somniferum]|uniref:Uncharacterized protein n=1 Tax=Papaver somniferum TaxID=3469 RepID=A0A4Y7KX41_PAPSO|nr:hypothetical protein C5167_002078 [Papaver somniferum]